MSGASLVIVQQRLGDVVIQTEDGTEAVVTQARAPTAVVERMGIRGPSGKDAYQLAVQAGYAGTLAQWNAERAAHENRLNAHDLVLAGLSGGDDALAAEINAEEQARIAADAALAQAIANSVPPIGRAYAAANRLFF